MRLPIFRIDVEPSSFISRTASTASRATSCVFSHASGSRNVVEKTIFRHARQRFGARLAFACEPDMTRYVVAPSRTVILRLRLLAQPRQVLRSFQPPPPGPALSGAISIERRDEVDK